jgi:nucleoside phosphorylase
MAVDQAWLQRNLGFDPLNRSERAAARAPNSLNDQAFARELIDYDSESSEGHAFAKRATRSTSLTKFVDPAWPAGLAPTPAAKLTGNSLPHADVLVVTWTMDEGHALSRVLTPGVDSKTDWRPYTKNLPALTEHMPPTAPARQFHRLGTFWSTAIGEHTVTVFKSDSHMSQDGPDLPNARVWKQIIDDTQPKLVISTGTGGAIGAAGHVGDVIVSRFATFDCQRQFQALDGQTFASGGSIPSSRFAQAKTLFRANRQFLPADTPTGHPNISTAKSKATGVLTTDFFGFDNTTDTYKLQHKGAVAEMGDAVLGMVCAELGGAAPPYLIVRNISDPQIAADGMTLPQQAAAAGDIYKTYGRWSTVCSAIVCWALIAAL